MRREATAPVEPEAIEHRNQLFRRYAATGLLVCSAVMAYLTLFPLRFQDEMQHELSWHTPQYRGDWLDVGLNFLFFIPFGCFGGWLWTGKRGAVVAVVAGGLFSFSVEWTQQYLITRDASLRDLLFNTLGTIAGVTLAQVGPLRRALQQAAVAVPRARIPAVVLIGVWVTALWFPFLPVLRIIAWRDFLRRPWVGGMSWLGYIDLLWGAGVAVLLLREFLGRRQAAVAGVFLAALVPMQIFLWGRAATAAEMAAPVAGLLAGAYLAFRGREPAAGWVAGSGLALVLVKQCMPFHWDTSWARPFIKLPFAASMDVGTQGSVRIIASKFFLYGTTVYFLRTVAGRGWIGSLAATLVVSGLLLVTEFGQRYQPGRTPESTDVVLTLGAGVMLVWAGRR